VTRNDDAVRLAIEADIALVVRGIAKKDAQGGAGGKFVGSGGGEIGIARAPEDAEMVIGWLNTEEGKVGGGKRKCFRGNDIEKVCCHAKGSSPKGGWYTRKSRERTTLLMLRMMRSALPFCAEV
jgi:hypothetical protein